MRDADVASPLRGAGPFRQNTRRRVAGRVILIGDASGYVDALTAEGLRIGFEEATAAVAAIRAGEPARFEQDWEDITRDFRRLTNSLVRLATSPVRGAIVPIASALPRVYCIGRRADRALRVRTRMPGGIRARGAARRHPTPSRPRQRSRRGCRTPS